MKTSATRQQKRHPIQVAARRSGLSQDVLRAWERRHGAVEPRRTEGNQRLYSDEDVERLRLLGLVVAEGRRISDVAALTLGDLSRLVDEDRAGKETAGVIPRTEPALIAECLVAIEALDASRLDQILGRELLSRGSIPMVRDVVAPLMREVGERWHAGRLGPGHEHLATEVLRGRVVQILSSSRLESGRGVMVVATTTEQRHEVGGLIAAAVAAQQEWRVIYLGCDLPAGEISSACVQVQADALALSWTFRNESIDDFEEISRVVAGLPAKTRVLVGGAMVAGERRRLEGIGAEVVEDLDGLREALSVLARPD